MVVSWTPLTYSEARGFITHYTVHYSPVEVERKRQALATMTQIVPGMDTNTTRIESLDPNTDYTVQVSATNAAGTSALLGYFTITLSEVNITTTSSEGNSEIPWPAHAL